MEVRSVEGWTYYVSAISGPEPDPASCVIAHASRARRRKRTQTQTNTSFFFLLFSKRTKHSHIIPREKYGNMIFVLRYKKNEQKGVHCKMPFSDRKDFVAETRVRALPVRSL